MKVIAKTPTVVSVPCTCNNCQRERHKFSRAWWKHFNRLKSPRGRIKCFRRLVLETEQEAEVDNFMGFLFSGS